MNHKPKILKSGTEIPLTDLRGKPYMNVAYRLVWFREEHPDWGIDTHLVEKTDKHAIVEATIINEQGRVIAKDRKLVTAASFQAYVEKATTGAIGRALALCGYGTQFDPEEFDEFEPKAPNQADACDTATVPPKKSLERISWPMDREEFTAAFAASGWSGTELGEYLFKTFGVEKVSDIKQESNYRKLMEALRIIV